MTDSLDVNIMHLAIGCVELELTGRETKDCGQFEYSSVNIIKVVSPTGGNTAIIMIVMATRKKMHTIDYKKSS